MNNKQLGISISLLLTISVFVSCNSDSVNYGKVLIGKWELEEASRGGEVTESLKGLFFEFGEEGKLNSNLPVAKGESMYEISGNTITQNAQAQTYTYQIDEISDSTLTLSTNLRNTDFQFTFKKAAE